MVLPGSHRVSRAPWYSGGHPNTRHAFSLTGLSPSAVGLSRPLQLKLTCYTDTCRYLTDDSYNPHNATPAGFNTLPVWAFPVSLAATQGIELSFSSSRYLDVSVPAVTFLTLFTSDKDTRALSPVGFPIRASPDHSLLAATRGISSLATPFIGS